MIDLKKYVYIVVFLTMYLFSTNFFLLVDVFSYSRDVILLLSVVIIFTNSFYIKKYINNKDLTIYLFYIYAILSSIFMAYINFGQPFVYSILVTRILLTFMLMYIALNILIEKIDLKFIYIMGFITSMIIGLVSFYIYFSGDMSLIVIDTTYAYRLGEVRISIATGSLVILLLFFYYESSKNKLAYIPFLLLLVTLVIVVKTRSVMIAIFLILLISMFNFKSKKIFFLWVSFILVASGSYILSDFSSSILSPIIKIYEATQTEVGAGQGNVNVRAMELAYFWQHLDFSSILFGYGMDNHRYKVLYYKLFYLSDLGIFKIFYLHGLIGLSLYFGFLLKLYNEAKKGSSSIHRTGRALLLFEIFAPSITLAYSPQGMMLTFIIYIIIYKKNLMERKNG